MQNDKNCPVDATVSELVHNMPVVVQATGETSWFDFVLDQTLWLLWRQYKIQNASNSIAYTPPYFVSTMSMSTDMESVAAVKCPKVYDASVSMNSRTPQIMSIRLGPITRFVESSMTSLGYTVRLMQGAKQNS